MLIKVDFNIIKCDKGHINNLNAKKCSKCGEVFDGIECVEIYSDLRKEKLKYVFETIDQNINDIEKLKSDLKKGALLLEQYPNPLDFEEEELQSIRDILNNPLFEELDLTSDIVTDDSFDKTEKKLKGFFNSLFIPLSKMIMFDKTTSFRKNILNRYEQVAIKIIDAYITLFESSIQDSFDKAKIKQEKGQKLLDELTIETNLMNRISNSYNIDKDFQTFNNGDSNYSVIAAMLIFNNVSKDMNEMTNEMKADATYFFRHFLDVDAENMSFDQILCLNVYMNSCLLFTSEQEFMKKISLSNKLLNEVNDRQPAKLFKYINDYKKRFIYMQSKLIEIQTSSALVVSTTSNEKILIYHMLKWYKDLCECVYRDTAILQYLCCCIIKDNSYSEPIFDKHINFMEIEDRFKSLKKYNLSSLTNGVKKIIRHAEAHVDYTVDYNNQIITFNNRSKSTTEYIGFDEFATIFDNLIETVTAMNCSFELFMINNRKYSTLFGKIHDELANIVNVSQADIAPLLRGIIVEDKTESLKNGEKILSIKGTCIDVENFIGFDSLFSIYYTIAQFNPEYDTIILDVQNLDFHAEMSTKLFKEYDSEKNNNLCLFALLKYLFSTKYLQGNDEKEKRFEMYLFILAYFGNEVLELKKYTDKLKMGKLFLSAMKEHVKNLIIDSEYIIRLFKILNEEIVDLRLSNHCNELIKNTSKHLKVIYSNTKFTNETNKAFEGIVFEGIRMTDVIKLCEGEIKERIFYMTKTTEGINKYKDVGRNDKCPCGSEVKFKKCCGSIDND